MEKGRE